MRFLFAILFALVPLRLGLCAGPEGADGAEKLDPSLSQAVSGGDWEMFGDYGDYRVLIFNRGYEHVSSQVVLQWVTHSREGARVFRSVLITELSAGTWSVGISAPFFGKSPTIQLQATHTYNLKKARFALTPGSPGQYALLDVSAPKAK